MRTIFPILSLILFVFSACTGEDPRPNESMYFPPSSGSDWEKTSISSLNWDESKLPDLLDFLESRNTKSFLILVNGRIVLEEYFDGHSPETPWQWNSAGKTLVTATTGIAQQEGILDIHAPISDYFGTGWTLLPLEKEGLITSRHLLTMTSGINDESQLVIKPNFTYLADAARGGPITIFFKN
ncbi:serine hydrolase [Algoriphagus boritolerans]|uniref:serine hydrolase n=1 Tax=Algoriphagus boritolerans TaxID=308111 RepID=UPI000AACCE13